MKKKLLLGSIAVFLVIFGILCSIKREAVSLVFLGYSTNASGTKVVNLCLTNQLNDAIWFNGGVIDGSNVASVYIWQEIGAHRLRGFSPNPWTNRFRLAEQESMSFSAPMPTNGLKIARASVYYLSEREDVYEKVQNTLLQTFGTMQKRARVNQTADAKLP